MLTLIVKKIKFLDLYIVNRLNFNIHNIFTKISKIVSILSKSIYYVPYSALLTLYFSLIYPYLTYGIYAWGSSTANYLNPIITQQKFAIKICNKPCLHTTHSPSV